MADGDWRALAPHRLAAPLASVALAVALLIVATASPLHEDEARYGVWALSLLRGDPWLLTTPIDKPPLAFYPMAASLALFGTRDWALRLPGILWTLLMLGTLARLARQEGISGRRAVGLAVLSPILWATGPTAFTDAPMVALALLAIERARAGRAAQAGLAGSLAFLAKPTALFLLPLLLAAAWPLDGDRRSGLARGAALPLILLWFWEQARLTPSLWLLGSSAYGTLGIPSTALLAWLRLLLIALGPMGLVYLGWRWVGHRAVVGSSASGEWRVASYRNETDARSRPHALTPSPFRAALAATLLLWLPAHLLLGFQPWERYLLPLVPLGALVAARWLPARPLPSAVRWVALLLLLAAPLMLRLFLLAPHDGRWMGIADIGAAVQQLPDGATVLYRDSGDPLRWYGAGSEATLRWAGPRWPSRVALPDGPAYVAARRGEALPAPLGTWPVVAESGHFVLRGGVHP